MATRQREKSAKINKERDKRPTAVARYIRISPDKVRIVLDHIRGKSYEQAVAVLINTNKSASAPILKVLHSAAANAENNLNIAKDNLIVAECWVMAGPTLKRMMPRARGRGAQILKRSSHIRIILDEVKSPAKEIKKPAKPAGKETKMAPKQATPKPLPKTESERPLTKEPNAKKPLGTKKITPSASAKKSTSKGAEPSPSTKTSKTASSNVGGKA